MEIICLKRPMARPLRIKYPGAYYHVMNRGNRREDIFLTDKDAPIQLLNVTYKKETQNQKGKKYTSKIIKKNFSHRVIPSEKSDLGKLFTRVSGKLKPVINLKTEKRYESSSEASRTENISISTLRNCCNSGKMLKDSTRYAYLDLNDNPILREGHNKEIYLGDRRRSKKVKNLINGKTYENSQAAAEEYDVSVSTIDGAARGKYMTVKEKYVFCFLDDDDNEIITGSHRQGLEKIREKDLIKYVAWHTDDANMDSPLYFKTLNDLCYKLQIRYKGHCKSVCTGKRYHVENWRIAYFNNELRQPILTDKHKIKPPKRLRKIICLNDNNKFKSGIEAGQYYGLNSSQVTKCAGGGAKSVYCGQERLRFAFLDDDGKPILTTTHEQPLSHRGKKRILRLKTGEIFNSLAEYLRETKIPRKRAKKYLEDPAIDLLGHEFIEID